MAPKRRRPTKKKAVRPGDWPHRPEVVTALVGGDFRGGNRTPERPAP
jgi:hypothetical protein